MINTPSSSPSFSQGAATSPAFIVDELALRRLRWPLFGLLTDIMVMDDAGDPESELRPLWDSNHTHPLALEPATKPPRTRMLINVHAIGTWDYWQDSGEEDSKPDHLIIENADGQPITIGKLVTEVHNYVSSLRELVYEVFSLPRSTQIQFYFDGFRSITRSSASNPDLVFPLHFKEDDGNMEWHWAQSARMVRSQRRNDPPQHGNMNSVVLQLQQMSQQNPGWSA